MRKLSEQPAASTAARPFAALSEADQRVLRSWISAARAAGIDRVMARSRFVQILPQLLAGDASPKTPE